MQHVRFPVGSIPEFVGFTADVALDTAEVAPPHSLATAYENAVSGILAAIEYRGREGERTRRRITMRRLSVQWDQHVLYAFCLESDGFRSFRLDGIECFITPEGEIIEPADYWADMAIDPHEECAAHKAAKDRDVILGPYLNLLCALADSDGERHIAEVERVMDALEIALEDQGEFLEEDARSWVRCRVMRTFPSHHIVDEAMEEIFGTVPVGNQPKTSASFRRRVLSGMRSVAEADGHLKAEEVEFFSFLEGMLNAQ